MKETNTLWPMQRVFTIVNALSATHSVNCQAELFFVITNFQLLLFCANQTPDNFEADFNEIIKREEEESGVQLSSSTEKTPRRVRTSLEEKYAQLSKTAVVVPATTTSRLEESQDLLEQHSAVVTVVSVLLSHEVCSF